MRKLILGKSFGVFEGVEAKETDGLMSFEFCEKGHRYEVSQLRNWLKSEWDSDDESPCKLCGKLTGITVEAVQQVIKAVLKGSNQYLHGDAWKRLRKLKIEKPEWSDTIKRMEAQAYANALVIWTDVAATMAKWGVRGATANQKIQESTLERALDSTQAYVSSVINDNKVVRWNPEMIHTSFRLTPGKFQLELYERRGTPGDRQMEVSKKLNELLKAYSQQEMSTILGPNKNPEFVFVDRTDMFLDEFLKMPANPMILNAHVVCSIPTKPLADAVKTLLEDDTGLKWDLRELNANARHVSRPSTWLNWETTFARLDVCLYQLMDKILVNWDKVNFKTTSISSERQQYIVRTTTVPIIVQSLSTSFDFPTELMDDSAEREADEFQDYLDDAQRERRFRRAVGAI